MQWTLGQNEQVLELQSRCSSKSIKVSTSFYFIFIRNVAVLTKKKSISARKSPICSSNTCKLIPHVAVFIRVHLKHPGRWHSSASWYTHPNQCITPCTYRRKSRGVILAKIGLFERCTFRQAKSWNSYLKMFIVTCGCPLISLWMKSPIWCRISWSTTHKYYTGCRSTSLCTKSQPVHTVEFSNEHKVR